MEENKYVYTDDMAEISGYGGSIEERCRTMVARGLKFADEHPELKELAVANFHKSISRMKEGNDELFQELADVMSEGLNPSGANFYSSLAHVFYIIKTGWDDYVEEMNERKKSSIQIILKEKGDDIKNRVIDAVRKLGINNVRDYMDEVLEGYSEAEVAVGLLYLGEEIGRRKKNPLTLAELAQLKFFLECTKDIDSLSTLQRESIEPLQRKIEGMM